MSLTLDELRRHGVVNAVDAQFARTLGRLVEETDEAVLVAAALACQAVTQANVCINLRELSAADAVRDQEGHRVDGLRWPEAEAWIEAVAASPLVARADAGEPNATPLGAGTTERVVPESSLSRSPLVLDGERLYLERYWFYETRVAAMLNQRAASGGSSPQPGLAHDLDRLGLEARPDTVNAQRLAVALALRQRLCVVFGGPGTGKTYTVAKILALLVEHGLSTDGRAPRIALLAPTGKAAARLSESIRKEVPGLQCADEARSAIPTDAATIHRYLGIVPDPRRGAPAERLIVADAVVVDEVSMVDIGLLWKLLECVPATTRIILLGDPNQLASVEAGTVLADLCAPPGSGYSPAVAAELEPVVRASLPRATGATTPALADCMVELTENRRYSRSPGIGALATAIHAGDGARVVAALRAAEWPNVEWVEGPDLWDIITRARSQFETVRAETGAAKQLRALERFRVLCAHRDGERGVAGINAAVERAIAHAGFLDSHSRNYPGQPILIERNDYQAGLFNGDVGLVVEHGARLVVAFPGEDGLREIAVSRLPAHSTVFAMTVHKSQGSEFDEVAVVLPAERSPVLSRELLYTAVTRAKERVRIYATEDVLRAAVTTRIRRASGLRARLWGSEGARA